MSQSPTIPVFAESVPDHEYLGDEHQRKIHDVSVATLTSNLNDILNQLEKILPQPERQYNKFKIEEIEIKLEVSAEGKIGILGTGIQAGANAGLSITLKRA
ncbi:Pepco domain-containing protein [Aggregatilinea lenta]|uniref:Pepco domain-containing protein n=1 Tax=Aggregatilinea lenta TaxID=913108 RepID=UPI0013C2A4CC|nr:hypothetical protein [Aggregatilinea lenta]